jgi:Polyketide cyclase / dehydrase and lipid transport
VPILPSEGRLILWPTDHEEVAGMTKQSVAEDGRIEMADLTVSARGNVEPERLYRTLADLSTHTTWAGSMHRKKNFGLLTIGAPSGAAVVGTEFQSTGIDPMGSFSDRSVVTEATEPSVFEFVTEGHLEPKKKGKPASDLRTTYRFEISGTGDRSIVKYRVHLSRWTHTPAMFRSRALQPLARAVMKRYAKKMLGNLTTYASEH